MDICAYCGQEWNGLIYSSHCDPRDYTDESEW